MSFWKSTVYKKVWWLLLTNRPSLISSMTLAKNRWFKNQGVQQRIPLWRLVSLEGRVIIHAKFPMTRMAHFFWKRLTMPELTRISITRKREMELRESAWWWSRKTLIAPWTHFWVSPPSYLWMKLMRTPLKILNMYFWKDTWLHQILHSRRWSEPKKLPKKRMSKQSWRCLIPPLWKYLSSVFRM